MARIQPTGVGPANEAGLNFYERFVDALLEAGIRPWCTLYHWDLPQALEDRGGWPNRELAKYFADDAGTVAKRLGDRIPVWAPFNMPWAIAFMGFAAGSLPPRRTSFADFLKAAHTLALAQGEVHRAVGSGGAARGLPGRVCGRAAAGGIGFKAGDEKLLQAPPDWIGFHSYTRRVVSDASKERFESGGSFRGVEIESNAPGGRDPYTRFRSAMPTEGLLTDAGLEVWPRGMYDLVTKISRDYGHPAIEITESSCGCLDGPDAAEGGRVPDARRIAWYRQTLAELARTMRDGALEREGGGVEPAGCVGGGSARIWRI